MHNVLKAHAWFLLTLLLVLVDWYTKQQAISLLVLHKPVVITAFLNLTLVHNTGAAFGLLASVEPTWQTVFLASVSCIAIIFFYCWFKGTASQLQRCAIALIIGGALGNLIDRIYYGYVIDFVDVYVSQYHWPAFNVADAAISLGVMLMIYSWVKYERH